MGGLAPQLVDVVRDIVHSVQGERMQPTRDFLSYQAAQEF